MATISPFSLALSGQLAFKTSTNEIQIIFQGAHENLRKIAELTTETVTNTVVQGVIGNLKKIPEPALPNIRSVLSNSIYSKSSPSSQWSSSPGLFVTTEELRCSSPVPEREEELSLPVWPLRQCDHSKEVDHLFSPSLSPSEFSNAEYRAPIAPMGIPATNDNLEIEIRAPSWSPITPVYQIKNKRVVSGFKSSQSQSVANEAQFIDHNPRILTPPSWSPITPKAQSPKHMFPSRQHLSDDPIDEDAMDLGVPLVLINAGDRGLSHIEHNCQGEKVFWTKDEYGLEGLKWAEETTRAAIKRYELKKAQQKMRVAKRREQAEKRRKKREEAEEKLKAAKRTRVSESRVRQPTEKRKLWEAKMDEEEMERVAKRTRVSGSRLQKSTAKMFESEDEESDEENDKEEIQIKEEKDDEYELSNREDSDLNMEDDEEASDDED
jgi:hypothetical protein